MDKDDSQPDLGKSKRRRLIAAKAGRSGSRDTAERIEDILRQEWSVRNT